MTVPHGYQQNQNHPLSGRGQGNVPLFQVAIDRKAVSFVIPKSGFMMHDGLSSLQRSDVEKMWLPPLQSQYR